MKSKPSIWPEILFVMTVVFVAVIALFCSGLFKQKIDPQKSAQAAAIWHINQTDASCFVSHCSLKIEGRSKTFYWSRGTLLPKEMGLSDYPQYRLRKANLLCSGKKQTACIDSSRVPKDPPPRKVGKLAVTDEIHVH